LDKFREDGMSQGDSEGEIISTGQRATFGLTPTLFRQQERAIFPICTVRGCRSNQGNSRKKARGVNSIFYISMAK
jgi:hypothetical protein